MRNPWSIVVVLTISTLLFWGTVEFQESLGRRADRNYATLMAMVDLANETSDYYKKDGRVTEPYDTVALEAPKEFVLMARKLTFPDNADLMRAEQKFTLYYENAVRAARGSSDQATQTWAIKMDERMKAAFPRF